MAKQLAMNIGYRYIDSGAMYRAVTLYGMRHGLVTTDGEVDVPKLISSLPDIHIDFHLEGDRQFTMLNGENVENEIRTLGVSNCVSPVAAIPEVRHALVKMQREMGERKGIVMDGRDIGTVVLPSAQVKIFITASPEIRAKRRFMELVQKGVDTTLEQVLNDLNRRDYQDSHRAVAPLKMAEDAVLVDTSELDFEQSVQRITELVQAAIDKDR